jgi:hypothetical protein
VLRPSMLIRLPASPARGPRPLSGMAEEGAGEVCSSDRPEKTVQPIVPGRYPAIGPGAFSFACFVEDIDLPPSMYHLLSEIFKKENSHYVWNIFRG